MSEIKFYIRENQYGFLSNFWKQQMEINGTIYKTNEHYYQSMKANTEALRKWIQSAPTAYLAMVAGRNLKRSQIVPNWRQIKNEIMLTGLRAKFEKENMRIMLLWTGDATLIEDSPTDMYWGGSLPASQNMLGKLLMQVRKEIKTNEELQ